MTGYILLSVAEVLHIFLSSVSNFIWSNEWCIWYLDLKLNTCWTNLLIRSPAQRYLLNIATENRKSEKPTRSLLSLMTF